MDWTHLTVNVWLLIGANTGAWIVQMYRHTPTSAGYGIGVSFTSLLVILVALARQSAGG